MSDFSNTHAAKITQKNTDSRWREILFLSLVMAILVLISR